MAIVRKNLGRVYCGTLASRHPELKQDAEIIGGNMSDDIKQAFEKVIVKPLNGRYDNNQHAQDFAMFSLGYRAARRTK